MEASEKNVLVEVLTKTLNKTPEEVSDLLYQKAEDSEELILKEDAGTLVLDADANRIANVKKSAKPDDKALKDKYLLGVKEGKAELEAEIKQLAGLDTTAIGSDLVKETINHLSDCNVPTEEQIKAHPLYVALEKDRVPKEDYDTMKKEYEDFKLNLDKAQTFSRVESDVLSIFSNLNPVVSENQAVAQTRQRDFLDKFKAYDFDIAEDGNHLIKQNGGRLEDAHGNPVKFADFVKDVASKNYEFNASDDKGNAGNTNDGTKAKPTDVPKTEADYLARMSALMALGDREGTIKLKKVWEESQKK